MHTSVFIFVKAWIYMQITLYSEHFRYLTFFPHLFIKAFIFYSVYYSWQQPQAVFIQIVNSTSIKANIWTKTKTWNFPAESWYFFPSLFYFICTCLSNCPLTITFTLAQLNELNELHSQAEKLTFILLWLQQSLFLSCVFIIANVEDIALAVLWITMSFLFIKLQELSSAYEIYITGICSTIDWHIFQVQFLFSFPQHESYILYCHHSLNWK